MKLQKNKWKEEEKCKKSQELKDEILFFIAVRSFISKLSGERIDVKEINANVAQMLERAIQDDEMLQIGEVHNSNQLALLSNDILNKLAKMQKKNIAVEVLNRANRKRNQKNWNDTCRFIQTRVYRCNAW